MIGDQEIIDSINQKYQNQSKDIFEGLNELSKNIQLNFSIMSGPFSIKNDKICFGMFTFSIEEFINLIITYKDKNLAIYSYLRKSVPEYFI